MLKFKDLSLDSWNRTQKLCWVDSCKAKIIALEKQMQECLDRQDYKIYFRLYDRLDQEIATLENLVREIAAPLTMFTKN